MRMLTVALAVLGCGLGCGLPFGPEAADCDTAPVAPLPDTAPPSPCPWVGTYVDAELVPSAGVCDPTYDQVVLDVRDDAGDCVVQLDLSSSGCHETRLWRIAVPDGARGTYFGEVRVADEAILCAPDDCLHREDVRCEENPTGSGAVYAAWLDVTPSDLSLESVMLWDGTFGGDGCVVDLVEFGRL